MRPYFELSKKCICGAGLYHFETKCPFCIEEHRKERLKRKRENLKVIHIDKVILII